MPSSSLSRRTSSHTAGPADRVEPGGRLVEEQHLGVVHERGGEVEAALHAARVGADAAVERVADVDQLAELVDAAGRPRAAEQAVEPALQAQQLGAGLLGVERRLLQRDADAQAHLARARRRRRSRRPSPRPPVGASSVHSMRTVVDLPAPFGPRKP